MPRISDRLDADRNTQPLSARMPAEGERDHTRRLLTGIRQCSLRLDHTGTPLPDEVELTSIAGRATGDLAIILDQAGHIVWLSRGCERVTGFRCDELAGQSLLGSPLVVDSGEVFGMFEGDLPAGNSTWTCEAHWLSKDGRPLRIIWSLASLGDQQGRAAYVVGTGIDVSQRPGGRESDRQEQLRLNSLLEISQKAADLSEREIIQHTLEEVVRLTHSEIGYLHFVNQDEDTIRLFAWSEGALRQCTAVSDSHYPISDAGVWADCARTKRPVVHNSYQELDKRKGYPEGHLHLIRHASIPIVDAGKVVIILGVGNKSSDYDDSDIRQMILAADSLWKIILRKRAEEQLREHIVALQDVDRRKDEFLGMLAHELRNPLAPISTALEILDQPDANEAVASQARRVIRRQMQHLTRLVDDLLDVSRLTVGKIALRRERIDLSVVVRNALDAHRTLLDSRRHVVNVRHSTRNLVVDGDLVRMTQIVGNLVHNAAKYTPEEGRIDIFLEEDGVCATLRVADSGVGIAPDVLPHVFDVFAQADRSLDRAEGGLGLGLALVRQLVELHGGTVEALSNGLHRGSEFVVKLPLAAAPGAGDPAEETSGPEVLAATQQRVLVVDDNQDAAAMLSELLSMTGCRVETAHDGSAALSACASFRPDVVLLDIGLPVLDGYQVAQHLRREHADRDLLLIAVTGYGDPQAIQQGLEAGFNHHLVKPVNFKTLNRLLDEHSRHSPRTA